MHYIARAVEHLPVTPSRNHHACVCLHEFCDIHSLVEQTFQCQSACSSVPKIWVLGVSVSFGAIHCIAWFFSFPTRTELLTWRISSVVITAVPIYIPSMLLLASQLQKMVDSKKFAETVGYFGALSGGVPYIIARAVTLVLAFTSLRDLPPGAYEAVHWTTLIPHI